MDPLSICLLYLQPLLRVWVICVEGLESLWRGRNAENPGVPVPEVSEAVTVAAPLPRCRQCGKSFHEQTTCPQRIRRRHHTTTMSRQVGGNSGNNRASTQEANQQMTLNITINANVGSVTITQQQQNQTLTHRNTGATKQMTLNININASVGQLTIIQQ